MVESDEPRGINGDMHIQAFRIPVPAPESAD